MTDIVHTVDVKQIGIVVELKLPRLFSFRMWLTIQVLKLAGFLSPINIKIASDQEAA